MDRLISDISKASKVDANLARETAKTLDVGEIAENIVEFYQQTRSKDGAEVVNSSAIDLNAPIYIRAYESPFAQVLRNLIDNALTFSPSHSGLGLAICRQIITAHRGKIYAENRKDDSGKILGAKFTVDVPRQESSGEV